MRVVAGLVFLTFAGCSSILGIHDPVPGTDGGVDIDGPPGGKLEINVSQLRLDKRQAARIRVQYTSPAGGKTDVSALAQLSSSDTGVATGAAGTVSSGATAGTATLTASHASATASLTVTVANANCHPVINELKSAGAGGAADEWVELYNPCLDAVDLTDWTLVYRGPNVTTGPDSSLMFSLSGQITAGGLELYAGKDYAGAVDGRWSDANGQMGGGAGSVGLRSGPKDTGPLVDSVLYGAAADVSQMNIFLRGTPSVPPTTTSSVARQPFDGTNTFDNGVDFALTTPTPRATNTPAQ